MVPPSVSLIGHFFSLVVMCFLLLLGDLSADLFKFSWAFLKMANFFYGPYQRELDNCPVQSEQVHEYGSDRALYLRKIKKYVKCPFV